MDFSNVSYQTACIILACVFNLKQVFNKCLGARGHFHLVFRHAGMCTVFSCPQKLKAVCSLVKYSLQSRQTDRLGRAREGIYYLYTYSYLTAIAKATRGTGPVMQFIFITKQKDVVVPHEIKPAHRNCFATNCHLICNSYCVAATQLRCFP